MHLTYSCFCRASALALLILSAGSCTVYTPMQPSLPGIRSAGQVELRASVQPTLRAEAAAAYSPANHVLLVGAGGWRPRLPALDKSPFQVLQGEVGMGTYWLLGPRWTLSGLGGYGWGQSERQVGNGAIIFNSSTDYSSRYRTTFGQVGLVYSYYRSTLALGYRLTEVRFVELRTREYALPLETQLRHEPFVALRIGLGAEANVNRWQLELSGALSLAQSDRVGSQGTYGSVNYRATTNRGGALLLGLGVVYRPTGKRTAGAL